MKNTFGILFLVMSCLNARAAVESKELQGFQDYIKIAKDEKSSMNARWHALMKSAATAEGQDIDQIIQFTESKEWYLRNAALVALNVADPQRAEVEAQRLLTDKALVVRSAAVEIIGHRMNDANKKILIEEVDKGYNYNKASSLWIRKQILEKVAKVATEKDQQIFVKNLFDQDKKISELCANTLEKLTGKKLARTKFVENWRQFAKHENWY